MSSYHEVDPTDENFRLASEKAAEVGEFIHFAEFMAKMASGEVIPYAICDQDRWRPSDARKMIATGKMNHPHVNCPECRELIN